MWWIPLFNGWRDYKGAAIATAFNAKTGGKPAESPSFARSWYSRDRFAVFLWTAASRASNPTASRGFRKYRTTAQQRRLDSSRSFLLGSKSGRKKYINSIWKRLIGNNRSTGRSLFNMAASRWPSSSSLLNCNHGTPCVSFIDGQERVTNTEIAVKAARRWYDSQQNLYYYQSEPFLNMVAWRTGAKFPPV